MPTEYPTPAGGSQEQGNVILGVVVQDLSRLQQVAGTVARHGFGDWIAKSPVNRLLFRGGSMPEETGEIMNKSPAYRFRRLLEALGPTYIKLGQILSMRPDLVAADYIEELQHLQDNTQALPFEQIRGVIEAELGLSLDDLYAEFEEAPLGTASIGQTYRAVTHEGEPVVVKVRRPGIEQVMRGDLHLLYLGAKILEATIEEMQLYSPSDIVAEFERALLQELDFGNEFHNLVKARSFLDPEHGVTVPRPYPELSCRSVLTMEFFDGISLRQLEPKSERARRAVEKLLHTSFKQCLHDGFFHGDPHPGNILINDDDVIGMIDLGLMGSLSPAQREDLVVLALAAVTNDVSTLARTLLRVGTPTRRVNMADFKADIERIRGEISRIESLQDYDSRAFSQMLLNVVNRHGIKVNTQYSVLAKSAATIEGIVTTLHPDVDIVGIAKSYAEQLLLQQFSPQRQLEDALGGVVGVGSLLRELPNQVDQVLHDVETGNLQIRVISPAVDELAPMLQRVGGRITLALFAAAMSLCGSILLPGDSGTGSTPFLGIAATVLAMVAWTALLLWHVFGDTKRIRLSPWLRYFRRE